MPRTLEIFDQIGIADDARQRGFPLEAGRVHVEGEAAGRFDLTGIDSRFGPLILAQSETERLLAEALEALGGEVERGVEWSGLHEEAGSVVSTLRDPDGGETVRSRWLAGCDGAHSDVRHAVDMPFEGAEYPESFVLADVRIGEPLDPGMAHLFFRGPDFLVAFPMAGERRFRLIATRPPGTEAAEDPDLAEFERLFDAVAGVEATVSDPEWLSRFRLHRRMVPSFRRRRVFLAGDAAHVHSPIGGQGMNTGVQDAWNLGWKLALVADGTAGGGLLDSYDAERRPIAEAILRWTDVAFRVALGQSVPARWARRLAPSVALDIEALQNRLARTVSQIELNYRDGPIVEEGDGGDFRDGPRPGDRAPDASLLVAGSGERRRIHDLLREPRHVLLWFLGGDRPAPEDADAALASLAALARSGPTGRSKVLGVVGAEEHAAAVAAWGTAAPLVDVDGEAFTAWGVEGSAAYLVRPDGHVAYRGPLDPAPFVEFLDRYR